MGYRWRGYEHPELHKMITTGPGAAASEPQTVYWKSLTEELAGVDQDLNTKLNTMGATWEGAAAESAKTGLTPLAEWAGDAETGSGVMRISSENQADYISDARARMPEPVEVTTQSPSSWDVLTAGAAALTGNSGPALDVAAQAADHEAQEAAQSEAEQRAVETMQTYESSSTWNRDTLGTFVAPPDVVVSTPAPQGGTATAVLIGNSQTRDVGRNTDGTPTKGPTNQVPTTNQVQTVTVGTGDPTGTGTQLPPTGTGQIPTPTPQVPPGTTTPQDVFVPPVGNSGGGLPPTVNPLPPGPVPGPGPLPGPGQLPGPYPIVRGGGDPFGGGGQNAQDVARRALPPVRGGFPGGPGGPGGMPGGAGGLAGGIDGERAPSQLGRGGLPGGLPGEGGVVRNAPGAAGAAGGRGGGGVNGPMGAGGRRGEGEDDDEHFAPDYLMETDDVFGVDRKVAPTVIGE